ncbi:hypothetical protein [Paractinoplanes durhamensis]|uniref:Uncharacterized protein n=1 Tax=Paractinoplanes durhamensis TaxID=113563 RepID=A0ABQ3Z0Z8_9ACTN|nr:hypothetical protein [Actinoplanes durhamensis]GIE03506.1 hypothetical protein Adu01nite_48560 [Actinoplanes durhamensis]
MLVKVRKATRWGALTALTALLAVAAPAVSAPRKGASATAKPLPACPTARASTRPPTAPAGPGTPGACRAAGRILESGVQLSKPATGVTPSGYHHLGANSAGEWKGVSGRISVVDGSIRPSSYDFIAARFMAKRNMGAGQINWLEAGWAKTGWTGPGRPRVYTFNTNSRSWQFYDQYVLKAGDRVWIDLHSDANGIWAAWLWWGNRWNLLTAQRLPIGPTAQIEQYVEVHVDPNRPTRVDVPAVTVDNVQLKPADGGAARYWRDDVPTLTGYDPGQQQRSGGFCLNWVNKYDTWTAGDCMGGTSGGDEPPTAPTAKPSATEAVVPRTTPQTTPPSTATPMAPLLGGTLG